MNNIIEHYDLLIDENNDPMHDPEPLKNYMDKWDGQGFIDKMKLDGTQSVLEIGVGTGRLAERTAVLCKDFTGIDISPKTIKRAKENLSRYCNVTLICSDFLAFPFENSFDVIYSSLTFMHIKDKLNAIKKIYCLLNYGGKFVLSVDKSQNQYIDTGTRKIKIYPDTPEETESFIKSAGFQITDKYNIEFASIFAAQKQNIENEN